MTAAERLLQLAGTTGSAAALLLAIGSGATAGEALNDYSSIDTGTAAEHLLSERVAVDARYYGGGRKQFSDATDAELEQLVSDKWDAIERANLSEKPNSSVVKDSLTVADHFRDATKMVEDVAETDFGNITPPSIIATHWPIAADEIAAAALAKSRRQAQEDEALMLILSELL